jgi:hypothetical protein
MAPTVYSIRRLGPIWSWRITQGVAAPAEGLAFSKSGARMAARNRVRGALQRLGKLGAPMQESPDVDEGADGRTPSG